MKRERLPDQGAYITVHLRNGMSFTGHVDDGHVWAKDEAETLLCLVVGPKNSTPDLDSGENLWQYVEITEIVAFTWDCR